MAKHRLGYAATNTELKRSTSKFYNLRQIFQEQLAGLIESNLESLGSILRWNDEHFIGLFRIGSGLIPYGARSLDTVKWPVTFAPQMAELGQWAENRSMRLTMHAGQYLSLNSPMPCVMQSALHELTYLATVMASLNLNTTCKIAAHVGGVYGDKETSLQQFIKAYALLPGAVKRRLILENDHLLFNIRDVLKVHYATGMPVVVNILNHMANPPEGQLGRNMRTVMKQCMSTWNKERDGLPIVHYATQKPASRLGSVAESVDTDAFLQFFQEHEDLDFDVMLDSQDREQSVLRVQRALGIFNFSGLAYSR